MMDYKVLCNKGAMAQIYYILQTGRHLKFDPALISADMPLGFQRVYALNACSQANVFQCLYFRCIWCISCLDLEV